MTADSRFRWKILSTRVWAVEDDFTEDVSEGGAGCRVEVEVVEDGLEVCGMLRMGASRAKMDAKDWDVEGFIDIYLSDR